MAAMMGPSSSHTLLGYRRNQMERRGGKKKKKKKKGKFPYMCLHVANRLARGAAGRVYALTAATMFAMSVRSTQVFIL